MMTKLPAVNDISRNSESDDTFYQDPCTTPPCQFAKPDGRIRDRLRDATEIEKDTQDKSGA
eukprot:4088998-Pyramimonas_sp.AAC.2